MTTPDVHALLKDYIVDVLVSVIAYSNNIENQLL